MSSGTIEVSFAGYTATVSRTDEQHVRVLLTKAGEPVSDEEIHCPHDDLRRVGRERIVESLLLDGREPGDLANRRIEVSFTTENGRLRNIVFEVTPDLDAPDPMENEDGLGDLLWLRRNALREFREKSGVDPNEFGDADSLVDAIRGRYGYAAPVDVYDHSGIVLALTNSIEAARFPDRRWDVASPGAIWVPDKCWMDEYRSRVERDGQDTADQWARKDIAGIIERMNRYFSGDIWQYRVELRDGESGELIHDDACAGFEGDDDSLRYMLGVATNAIAVELDEDTTAGAQDENGQGESANLWILEMAGDVEPVRHGPYKSEDERLDAARALREQDPNLENGLYRLETEGGTPVVIPFSGAGLEPDFRDVQRM